MAHLLSEVLVWFLSFVGMVSVDWHAWSLSLGVNEFWIVSQVGKMIFAGLRLCFLKLNFLSISRWNRRNSGPKKLRTRSALEHGIPSTCISYLRRLCSCQIWAATDQKWGMQCESQASFITFYWVSSIPTSKFRASYVEK